MRGKYEPTPMGDKRFYVYEHRYPKGFIGDDEKDLSDIIFYVGKGTVSTDGVQRIDYHEMAAGWHYAYGPGTKESVIRSIWGRGMQVKKKIVFETDNEDEALCYEKNHIVRSASIYLTNVVHSPMVQMRRELYGELLMRTVNNPVPTVIIHSHIHPALIVDGKMSNKDFLDRAERLSTQGYPDLVVVATTCKVKWPDGSLCVSHIGDEVAVAEVLDPDCSICQSGIALAGICL